MHVLSQFLGRSAQQHPDRIAVVDARRSITYAALDRRVNQIADLLLELGVERGDRVAVLGTKSIEMVAALYAIMRSGAAYVPLDPKAPAGRSAVVLRESGAKVLLSTRSRRKRWPDLVIDTSVIDIVALDFEPDGDMGSVRLHGVSTLDERREDDPGVAVGPDDLAYIFFTSGSTGTPKGVTLTHRNGASFVEWAVRAVSLTFEDRLSSHAPFHFDLSVFDLYAAAFVGASVHLIPESVKMFPIEVATFIREHQLTVWYSVPTALRELVDLGNVRADQIPALRVVIFAGEVFPAPALVELIGLLPGREYWNWFGPTETNVCTAYPLVEPPDVDGGDVPIGMPIDGVDVIVLADGGRNASVGEPGELLVWGSTVTTGYWNDPERTARSLTPHPFDPSLGPVFRTGDLVVRREDGNLGFIGRRDHQIKSRGHRIELGDIETAIHRHPAVVEAAVVAVPDPRATNRIEAFVVLSANATAVDITHHCRESLPDYMVPSRVEAVHALPRTSTGKVDRSALELVAREPSDSSVPSER